MADFNFYLNRQGVQGRKGDKGETGYSPFISVAENTANSYKLRIQNESSEFITDNLRGNAIENTGGSYIRFDQGTEEMYTGYLDVASTSSVGGVILSTPEALAGGGVYDKVPTAGDVYDFVTSQISGSGLNFDDLSNAIVAGNNITINVDSENETLTINSTSDTSSCVKYTDISTVVNSSSTDSTVASSKSVYTAIQNSLPDLSGYQVKSNLVTSMSASSTDTQYPSAKCVYESIQSAGGNFITTNTDQIINLKEGIDHITKQFRNNSSDSITGHGISFNSNNTVAFIGTSQQGANRGGLHIYNGYAVLGSTNTSNSSIVVPSGGSNNSPSIFYDTVEGNDTTGYDSFVAYPIWTSNTVTAGTGITISASGSGFAKKYTISATGTMPTIGTGLVETGGVLSVNFDSAAGIAADGTTGALKIRVDGSTIDFDSSGNLKVINGGGITIDQTFNGASTNAQSGVAIAGELSNYALSSSVPMDTSDLTNGAGFITGITSGDVTTALGYTPYDSSNPSGYTSNVGTVTSVNNISPVNGNVTLTIPAAQVNSDWNATSGVAQILNKPTNISSFTNDSGYITGITGTDVTNALGYTPYDSTNPNGYTSNTGTVTSVNNVSPVSGNVSLSIPTDTSDLTNGAGYITGITSSDVTTALGYTPYDSSNPSGYTTNVGTVTSVNNTSPDANGNVSIALQNLSAGTGISTTGNSISIIQSGVSTYSWDVNTFGSVDTTGGIYSNFSDNNRIQMKTIPSSFSKLEMNFRITTGNNITDWGAVCGQNTTSLNCTTPQIELEDGILGILLSTNGSSWNVQLRNSNVAANTTYDVYVLWESNTVTATLTDVSAGTTTNFTLYSGSTTLASIEWSSAMVIGADASTGGYAEWLGTIDSNYSYIKLDNQLYSDITQVSAGGGVAKATISLYGLVKPDGTTITINNGVISAVQPTSEIDDTTVSTSTAYSSSKSNSTYVSSTTVRNIVTLTQSDYNLIQNPDPNTEYHITDVADSADINLSNITSTGKKFITNQCVPNLPASNPYYYNAQTWNTAFQLPDDAFIFYGGTATTSTSTTIKLQYSLDGTNFYNVEAPLFVAAYFCKMTPLLSKGLYIKATGGTGTQTVGYILAKGGV